MRRLIILTVIALAVAATGAPVAASAGTGEHPAITITSDSQFTAPGSTLGGCQCVTAGDGTSGNPYVIGPWAIKVPSGVTSGWAIKVDNSGCATDPTQCVTKWFTISGISANYSGVEPPDPVIWLVDVNNVDVNNPAFRTTISNVSANEDGIGVELQDSSNITLDQLSFNKMNGTGLYITGLLNSDGSCMMDKESSNIWVSNSKFKSTADGQPVTSHNADGVYADCSSNLSIGGVSACPGNQICNSFDYDSGFGVYLQNTQNSTIDRASANADDTAGYVLDNSSGVTLSNSGGGSDGPICFSSNGQRGPTGYMTNNMQGNLLLIRGSQDNTIQNDQFAAPIGGDSIHSGGNTFYYDPCSKSKITPSPLPPGWLPPDAGMGSGNMFPGTCYRSTNIVGLPPAPCK